MPNTVLWAWERAEDLSSLSGQEMAVAYLAERILLTGDKLQPKRRNQPLKVGKDVPLVAVIRLDTDSRKTPAFSDAQVDTIVRSARRYANAPQVIAIQIDFDARVTERPFYKALLRKLRDALPSTTGLSITALASWCLGDHWIGDLPVDEEIPMMFSLGRDRHKVLNQLRGGGDFVEGQCRRAVGISLEDNEVNNVMIPIIKRRTIPARVYVFTRAAWNQDKIEKVRTLLANP